MADGLNSDAGGHGRTAANTLGPNLLYNGVCIPFNPTVSRYHQRPMVDETFRQLKSIETQIDEEYAKCVPGLGCWEADAIHLLMAHECASLGSDPRLHADASKYDLMHAIRWAARDRPDPDWQIPSRLTIESIDRARSCLARAGEYVAFCGGCWKAFNGVVAVEFPNENEVAFSANPDWTAYDILDAQLNEEPVNRDELNRFLYSLQKAMRRSRILHPARLLAPEIYTPDLGSLEHALNHLMPAYRRGEILPPTWRFRDVSIDLHFPRKPAVTDVP